MEKHEAKQARFAFAASRKDEINRKVREYRFSLWRAAAKEAKAAGLYSKKTFDYDAANGLMSMIGERR